MRRVRCYPSANFVFAVYTPFFLCFKLRKVAKGKAVYIFRIVSNQRGKHKILGQIRFVELSQKNN